jgi:hypothetical protein
MIALASCSVQKKIEHKYNGNGRDLLLSDFGEPRKIIDLEDGNQLFLYVKETFVREAEIGTGRFTLDKRVSPSFIKEEIYRFVVDSDGIILLSEYEKRQK